MARREAFDPTRTEGFSGRPEAVSADDGPGSAYSPPPIRRDDEVPAVTGELATPASTPFVPEFESPSPKRRWLQRPAWVAEPKPVTTKARGGTVVTHPPLSAPDWQDATRVGGRSLDGPGSPRRRSGPAEVETETIPVLPAEAEVVSSGPELDQTTIPPVGESAVAPSLFDPEYREISYIARSRRDIESGFAAESESEFDVGVESESESQSELDTLLAELSAVSSDDRASLEEPQWFDRPRSFDVPTPMDPPSWFDEWQAAQKPASGRRTARDHQPTGRRQPDPEPLDRPPPDTARPAAIPPKPTGRGDITMNNPAPVRRSGGRPPLMGAPAKGERGVLAGDTWTVPVSPRHTGLPSRGRPDRGDPGWDHPESRIDPADGFTRAGARPTKVDAEWSYAGSLRRWPRWLATGLTFLVIFVVALLVSLQIMG